jgi:undecaprenyl-diphosphatase
MVYLLESTRDCAMKRSQSVIGLKTICLNIDARIVQIMNGLVEDRKIRLLFSVVSRLGDGWGWALIGLALLLWDGAAAIPVVLKMLFGFALGHVIYYLIKNKAARIRPCDRDIGLRISVEPLDQFSFPSGHTLHAVLLTIVVVSYSPCFAVVLVPFVVLIALSRIILGLHYPSDVVVGAAMGAFIAFLLLLF